MGSWSYAFLWLASHLPKGYDSDVMSQSHFLFARNFLLQAFSCKCLCSACTGPGLPVLPTTSNRLHSTLCAGVVPFWCMLHSLKLRCPLCWRCAFVPHATLFQTALPWRCACVPHASHPCTPAVNACACDVLQGLQPNPLEARPRGATMNMLQQAPRSAGSGTPAAESARAEQILVDSFSEQVIAS